MKFEINSFDFPVRDLVEKFDKGFYKIPRFQRQFTYKPIQSENLIVSIISNLSIDSITVIPANEEESFFYISDGMHRTKTISDYY